jgi:hypothetical protein
MFTHVWRARPDGPWTLQDGDDDPTDFDHVRSFLLNTRYWWLEGVDTAKLRRGIDAIFDKHDIETLAPGYGCILRGRKVVARASGRNALVFKLRGRLKPGRYTLVVDGTRLRVTVRR